MILNTLASCFIFEVDETVYQGFTSEIGKAICHPDKNRIDICVREKRMKLSDTKRLLEFWGKASVCSLAVWAFLATADAMEVKLRLQKGCKKKVQALTTISSRTLTLSTKKKTPTLSIQHHKNKVTKKRPLNLTSDIIDFAHSLIHKHASSLFPPRLLSFPLPLANFNSKRVIRKRNPRP